MLNLIKHPSEFWKNFILSDLIIKDISEIHSYTLVNHIYEKYFFRWYNKAEIFSCKKRILFKYYGDTKIDENMLNAHLGIITGIISKIYSFRYDVYFFVRNEVFAIYVKIQRK